MTDAKDAVLEYLRHIGAGLDPDFLREAIKVMSASRHGSGSATTDWRRPRCPHGPTDDLLQWLSGLRLEYSSRGNFAQVSQTARGELFPEPARTPTANRHCS